MAAAIHTASVLAGEADVRRLAGAIEADDELVPTALVGDELGFLRVTGR